MKKNRKTIEDLITFEENASYAVLFKRFNRITFFTGIAFFIFAITNLPWAYNPEIDALTFQITGKPTITFITTITGYMFMGIIPILMGLIFLLFSLITSRKIILVFYSDGKARYIKKGFGNFLLDTQIDFKMKDSLQQIKLGRRHQRAVIWLPVIVLVFLIYMLLDYINFLDITFDITFYFYDLELSLKAMLIYDIIFMVALIIPYTLFPRKLCRIDTSKEFIQFDYRTLELFELSTPQKPMHFIEPFKILCDIEKAKKQKNSEKNELKSQAIENINFNKLPEILRKKIDEESFQHKPVFMLYPSIGLFAVVLITWLIPNYFFGGFTFKVEFFLTIAAYYFLLRTIQNDWFSNQEVKIIRNGNDLLIKRENRIFGTYIDYFTNYESINYEYHPLKPHFLEYFLFFLPICEIIWFINNMATFSEYFFTENFYTPIHIAVIVLIFFSLFGEYLFPRNSLNITPKSQENTRKVKEIFYIYFPIDYAPKWPSFREALKDRNYLRNCIPSLLLILVPVIFGIIWIILSSAGILLPIYDTIF
ncbi:MAG: hypothetical protein ACTSQP_09235 [Promethearchaeota archaeon]